MQSKLNPYLSFQGTAREAMEFYKSIFGGTVEMTTYLDGGMTEDPERGKLIMHSELQADNGISFMASDTPDSMEYNVGTNISMSLSGDDAAELTAYFEGLTAGGTIREPLVKAPWGDTFGILTDKFRITWMVNIAGPKA